MPGHARVAVAVLEDLLRRALEACKAPAGWISFLEEGVERLAAGRGVAFGELPAARSFALQGAIRNGALYVEDALAEARWRGHPLVAAGPRARMFAVVPLREGEQVVGTLTLLDPFPRRLGRTERTALANLAALASARLEARAAPGAVPDAVGERLEAELRRRQGVEAHLEAERELVQVLLENLGGAFFLCGADGSMLRWNAAFAAAVGHDEAAIGTARIASFFTAADRPLVDGALRDVLEREREVAIEAEVADAAGNVRPYLLTARPVALGGRRCVLGMARDIVMRRRNEQQMARAKERLDLALAGSRLALWDWDLANRRVYFNENWSKLRGEAPCEATHSLEDVLRWPHGDDRDLLGAALGNVSKGVSDEVDCEWRLADAEGEWIWVHWRGRVTQRDAGGAAARVTGTATNATQRKRAEERAEWLATRDALTGLPNRVLLHDRLEQAVANAARHHTGFAFMFIDLDRFKTINDSLGHHVGDELLKEVAKRLSSCVRATDTVARLGGDEFAVLLENLRDDDHEGAGAVATKMVASMAAPLVVEGQPLNTSCSVGVSLYPGDGRDSATLMKNADVAMYHAKEKGRNNFRFYSAEMNARAQERLSVENYLRLAIRRGELLLHFQPRKRVADGALVGAEALVRWQHPRRGLIGPDRFMDVAEESGLIVALGEWVIGNACAHLAAWQRRIPGFRLSVNVSLRQAVNGERLHDALAQAVAASGADLAGLELELTEAHLMQDASEKVALLNRLAGLGVRIAIDDFGTGYSSLSVLKRLPVDAIKVDGSFVRDIERDPNDRAIVEAILAMAHALGMAVVAEGVETPAQLAALRALGCDQYQGYLECPPIPAAQFQRAYLDAMPTA